MMFKMKCLHCFSQITDNTICDVCGFDNYDYKAAEIHLAPGTIIANRYELGRVIGEGGFGITYTAFDMVLKSRCAVKEYFPKQFSLRSRTSDQNTYVKFTLSGEEEYKKGLEKFKNEASRLAVFDGNRNIVNIKNYISENNTGYIIMNFVEGISLKEYLISNKGKLSPEVVFGMMKPVIQTLSEVHSAGIIHRDISLDNIIAEKDGRLVLIDFGAAREYDAEKSLSVILTHGFAPPEQYSSTSNQGPWTDVYSLCAVMYVMLTGCVPPDAMERLNGKSLKRIKNFGVNISSAKERVLLKGLSIHSEERWQSTSALYDALYKNNALLKNKKAVALSGISVAIIAGALIIGSVVSENVRVKDVIAETTSVTQPIIDQVIEEEPAPILFIASGTFNGGSWTLSNEGVLDIQAIGSLNFAKAPWSKYKTDVTAIVLSDGIMEIGDEMFYRMTKLESVTLPDSLVRIGNQAFAGTALKKIYIPDSVEYIGDSAFMQCEQLSEVRLPSEIDVIRQGTFSKCISLEEIYLPDTIRSLYSSCFHATGLKTLTLPAGPVPISSAAFSDCDKLEKIIFPAGYEIPPDNNIYIYSDYFISGPLLKDIYFENGISAETIECVAPYIKRTAEGFCNVYLPDDMALSNVEMNKFKTAVTFVGDSNNASVLSAAKNFQSVEITDGMYPENYLKENILYINSQNYFEKRDFDVSMLKTTKRFYTYDMTYNEYEAYMDYYNGLIENVITEIFPKYLVSSSLRDSYTAGELPFVHISITKVVEMYDIGTPMIFVGSTIWDPSIPEYMQHGMGTYDRRIFLNEASKAMEETKLIVVGVDVTDIKVPIFNECEKAEAIFIPDTVTSICNDAFDKTSLKKIYTNSEENSFLRSYAETHGLEFEVVNSADEIISEGR